MILITKAGPRNFQVACDTHGSLTRGQTTVSYAWDRAVSHIDEASCPEEPYEVAAHDGGFVVRTALTEMLGNKRYRDRASAMRAARLDEANRRGQ